MGRKAGLMVCECQYQFARQHSSIDGLALELLRYAPFSLSLTTTVGLFPPPPPPLLFPLVDVCKSRAAAKATACISIGLQSAATPSLIRLLLLLLVLLLVVLPLPELLPSLELLIASSLTLLSDGSAAAPTAACVLLAGGFSTMTRLALGAATRARASGTVGFPLRVIT